MTEEREKALSMWGRQRGEENRKVTKNHYELCPWSPMDDH